MQRLHLILSIMFATWLCLFSAAPSLAADPGMKTPEGAIAAYVDGVARRDFKAVIAATAIERMSRNFDFVAYIDRLKALGPTMPAPASDPFLVAINEAGFEAQIAFQVKFLTYGLMTTSEVLQGKMVMMDAAKAGDFATVVRADRLAGLKLLKVGIPNPVILNSERYQVNAARMARVYGAETSTERLALLSFEGLHFVIGFELLNYGDNWAIRSQSSAIAGISSMGSPERVTPEKFEAMLK
jgi:hypothetical protein